ncbi:hypothetical protein LCGC14_2755860, partial [marine sediment metagenome]
TIDYMIAMTHRADLSAELLQEIAANNGHPELSKVSTATIRRRLKERQASRRHFREAKERKPRRRWEAARPNDLHQVDYTIMQQFYIDDDGSIGFESPLHRSKNKAGNKKPRLVLFALVDDHSRARYMRAYPGANTLFMLDFLHHAWSPKEAHAFPFRGLPRVLYSDNDSIIKSHKFQRAAGDLGVEVKTHFPGEAQAKGKVEASFRWSKEMEKVTLISKFESLDEVNQFLWDRMLYYNNRRHSTTKVAPFARWLTIHDDELREIPEAIWNALSALWGRLTEGDRARLNAYIDEFVLSAASPPKSREEVIASFNLGRPEGAIAEHIIALVTFLVTFMSQAAAMGAPNLEVLNQETWTLAPVRILEIRDLVEAERRDLIDRDGAVTQLRAWGYDSARASQWLALRDNLIPEADALSWRHRGIL